MSLGWHETTTNSLSGENNIRVGLVGGIPGGLLLVAGNLRTCSSLWVFASQTLAVPSQDAVAIQRPSGEYATDVTRSLCPRSERTVFNGPSSGIFPGGASPGSASLALVEVTAGIFS